MVTDKMVTAAVGAYMAHDDVHLTREVVAAMVARIKD